MHLTDADPPRQVWQECLHSFRGITFPGIFLRNMVADLPAPVPQGNQLDVTDVFPAGLCQHGIGQRALRSAVPGNQEIQGFPGFLHRFKYLVRHKSPVILIQGILMDFPGHIRGKLRDDQPLCFNPHGIPPLLRAVRNNHE